MIPTNGGMFGRVAPAFPSDNAPIKPQVLPAQPQTQPGIPGSRLAKTLLGMQFNRNPTNALGSIGNAFDQIGDAWGQRHMKNKGWITDEADKDFNS